MQITILDAATASTARLVARVVRPDGLSGDMPALLAQGAEASRFKGKPGQLFEGFVEVGGQLRRVALAGIGKPDAAKSDTGLGDYEKAGAALAAKYLTSGEGALALDLSGTDLSGEQAAALLLGLRLRGWRQDGYRTRQKEEQKVSLRQIDVIGAPAGLADLWADHAAVAEGVEFARMLVTEPANKLYPESFVTACEARFAGTGLVCRVLGEDEMRSQGMGALLGVAQGSVRPPRLLAIEWAGSDATQPPLALVGKGVTFDTGGISLKPGAGMEDMKFDMGGAAAVVGTMLTLARRKAPAHVVGICGLVENMPDGNAQRPGDVVTSMSGQTIEVINTDAEGRLVLCDVLTYVQRRYAPHTIVDLATLTGAIIASLGHEYAGIFSTDEALAGQLIAAGQTSGDRLWRMPMGAVYDKMIDSPIADMKNMGSRYAGSITAAQFLARFVEEGTPWAHLDIAGTVWTDKPGATWEKGATGYGVRLLDRFVRDCCEAGE